MSISTQDCDQIRTEAGILQQWTAAIYGYWENDNTRWDSKQHYPWRRLRGFLQSLAAYQTQFPRTLIDSLQNNQIIVQCQRHLWTNLNYLYTWAKWISKSNFETCAQSVTISCVCNKHKFLNFRQTFLRIKIFAIKTILLKRSKNSKTISSQFVNHLRSADQPSIRPHADRCHISQNPLISTLQQQPHAFWSWKPFSQFDRTNIDARPASV